MRSWAVFFARVILGLIFGMAGYWKCFVLTPIGHARGFFIETYADTWIPVWILWTTGLTVPVVELIAGWLLVVGWRRREALLALGFVLVLVTYGHLLLEPLYVFIQHVIPRLALLLFVMLMPLEEDIYSVDHFLKSRSRELGIGK